MKKEIFGTLNLVLSVSNTAKTNEEALALVQNELNEWNIDPINNDNTIKIGKSQAKIHDWSLNWERVFSDE